MITVHNKIFSHDQSIIAAQKALAVFLNQPANNIYCKLLTGGSDEAAIVKCTHLEVSYVIKFFSTGELGKNETAWTQLASELGIGPELYYVDPAGDYILIEFVKGNSLIPDVANRPIIIKNIATSIARLHHSDAPFAHVSDMFTRIDTKFKKLHCRGALKDLLENGLQRVKAIEIQLKNIAVPAAPCHNDLNPGNIFTHNDHIILIDWGDAALGNPYYDIAAFFVLNVINVESEHLFLKQYDPKLLEQQWQTYMQLCKQLVHFEFALNLLLGVQAREHELLHVQHLPQVNNINYYLTFLAKQEMEINSTFLYNMAIASLDEMDRQKNNVA